MAMIRESALRLVRVSCDAGGRVNHWLLADANEASGGPVEILGQQYHSAD